MTNNNLSLNDAGSLLLGVGLAKLDNVQLGLILLGAGALLKILVAILNKQGIQVQSNG